MTPHQQPHSSDRAGFRRETLEALVPPQDTRALVESSLADGFLPSEESIQLLADFARRVSPADGALAREAVRLIEAAYQSATIASGFNAGAQALSNSLAMYLTSLAADSAGAADAARALKRVRESIAHTRNIGFIAHVAAGKSTLTELILFLGGCIRERGDVHDGSTALKHNIGVEQQRMTVTAGLARLCWRDALSTHAPHTINLIDTPGHFDFGIEVVRSLRVLEGCVVLLDASKGVEPQTRHVWREADRCRVPRLCFLNKMDHFGARFPECIDELRKTFGEHVVPLQLPLGEGERFHGIVDLITRQVTEYASDGSACVAALPEYLHDAVERARTTLFDRLGLTNDTFMGRFFDGSLDAHAITAAVRRETLRGNLVPAVCGSAHRAVGVRELLASIVRFLPSPLESPLPPGLTCDPAMPLTAFAFKTDADHQGDVRTLVRVLQGRLEPHRQVLNARSGAQKSFAKLFRMDGVHLVPAQSVEAGEFLVLSGKFDIETGDTLCEPSAPLNLERINYRRPIVRYRLEAQHSHEIPALISALRGIARHDPSYHLEADERTGHIIIGGMGPVHIRMALRRLESQHRLAARLFDPEVIYHASIRKPASAQEEIRRIIRGHVRSGRVVLAAERIHSTPGVEYPPNEFGTALRETILPQTCRDAFEAGVRDSLLCMDEGSGVFPVIGVRITLQSLSCDFDHAHPELFHALGALGTRSVLSAAGVVKLEPWVRISMECQRGDQGKIQAIMTARHAGVLLRSDLLGQDAVSLEFEIPLRELFSLSEDLLNATGARAGHNLTYADGVSRYAPLHSSH